MKILIISYAPLCLYSNGGKSFLSLFSNFSSDELIQFYINPGLPDGEWCSSFYQQKESDLIKLFKNLKVNHFVTPSSVQQLHSVRKEHSKRFRTIKLLLRDFVWLCFFRINYTLDNWIKKNGPDFILSDTGDSSFLYRISMKFSKRYNIPIIGYFGDNYYSIKCPWWSFARKIQLSLLKRTIKKFTLNNFLNIFVNRFYRDFFKERFSLPDQRIITIYNGANFDFSDCDDYHIECEKKMVFSYIGNLSLGRGDNIILIGKALSLFNKQNRTDHKLLIFASATDDFKEQCELVDSINYMGVIPGEKVKEAIIKSDILIHTESFETNNLDLTRYSMSTKIGDSLASGKCLLAFGPIEASSIRYLVDEGCAFCITSKERLAEMLKTLIINIDLIEKTGKKGKRVADKNHNSHKNSIYLKEVLNKELTTI